MRGKGFLPLRRVRLQLHWGSSSRWAMEERAFDGFARFPAVSARRAVARGSIISGHGRPQTLS
jgi:hypothetical protein